MAKGCHGRKLMSAHGGIRKQSQKGRSHFQGIPPVTTFSSFAPPYYSYHPVSPVKLGWTDQLIALTISSFHLGIFLALTRAQLNYNTYSSGLSINLCNMSGIAQLGFSPFFCFPRSRVFKTFNTTLTMFFIRTREKNVINVLMCN